MDNFVYKYYLEPRPERIPDAMVALMSSGVLRIPEDLIDEVLSVDPVRLQLEMIAFRNRQIRSGKWE